MYVDRPLLTRTVLVDTPGTGDVATQSDMVRDYLPVCDLILYLFSAAVPFDEADAPLLQAVTKELPFIPSALVLTRADEFSRQPSTTLSDETLDTARAEDFCATLAARLNARFGTEIAIDRITLVDNRSLFGIEALRSLVERVGASGTVGQQIAMHAHKVRYYLVTSCAIREAFASELRNKLQTLTGIWSSAETTVAQYQDEVALRATTLLNTWRTARGTIENLPAVVSARLGRALELGLDMWSTRSAAAAGGSFEACLVSAASDHVHQALDRATKLAVNAVASYLRSLEDTEGTPAADDGDPAETVSPNDFKVPAPEIDAVPPQTICKAAAEARRTLHYSLTALSGVLRSVTDELVAQIRHQVPLVTVRRTLEEAGQALEADVAAFLKQVLQYHTFVFSHGTKEAISRLGIGGELDALERARSEQDPSQYSREAKSALLPDLVGTFARFSEQSSDLATTLSQVRLELGSLQLKEPPWSIPSATRAGSAPSNQVQVDAHLLLSMHVRAHLAEVAEDVARARATHAIDLSSRRRIIREVHTRFVRRAITVSGFAAAGAYVLYLALSDWSPASAFWTIALGVFAELLGHAVGWAITRVFDPTPGRLDREGAASAREAVADVRGRLRSAVLQPIEGGRLEALAITLVTQWRSAMADQATAEWLAVAETFYGRLSDASRAVDEHRDAYGMLTNAFAEETLTALQEAQSSSDALRRLSETIRKREIEPSFSLLRETRDHLQAAETRIAALRFDPPV